MLTINKSFGDKNNKTTISKVENNLCNYIELYRKLLLLNEKNNIDTAINNIKKFTSFNDKIFSSSSAAKTFLYFCLNGAATAWVIQTKLNMPEATTYRALKRLRSLRIIVPALKVAKIKSSKGGPRPTIWSLEDASTDEISTAIKLHYKLLSPKYRIAEKVAQTILDEYINNLKIEEISYKQILLQVKELRIPFRVPDIAELAANYLNEKGIKVWR